MTQFRNLPNSSHFGRCRHKLWLLIVVRVIHKLTAWIESSMTVRRKTNQIWQLVWMRALLLILLNTALTWYQPTPSPIFDYIFSHSSIDNQTYQIKECNLTKPVEQGHEVETYCTISSDHFQLALVRTQFRIRVYWCTHLKAFVRRRIKFTEKHQASDPRYFFLGEQIRLWFVRSRTTFRLYMENFPSLLDQTTSTQTLSHAER